MNDEKSPKQIQEELQDFFPQGVVGWKPQAVKDNRALAVAYIDARDVENRLDDVVGIGNWQDAYTPLDDGNVICTLSLRIGGEWVSKSDVGGESEQSDGGDRRKASFSDAFKRAAVKWGIGRYLYSMPHQWEDYDPKKRQFAREPKVPAQFLPKKKPAEQPHREEAANGKPAEKKPCQIETRLRQRSETFGKEVGVSATELYERVCGKAKAAGMGYDPAGWNPADYQRVGKFVEEAEAELRQKMGDHEAEVDHGDAYEPTETVTTEG